MLIRQEKPGDAVAIRVVNEAAFGRPDEADLVDRLRRDDAVILSLVAERNCEIIGHILFSRMWIDCERETSTRLHWLPSRSSIGARSRASAALSFATVSSACESSANA